MNPPFGSYSLPSYSPSRQEEFVFLDERSYPHSRESTQVITPRHPSQPNEEHSSPYSRAILTSPRVTPPSINPPLPIDDRLSHYITVSSLLHPELSIQAQLPQLHHYTHLKHEDLSPYIDRSQADSLGSQHDVSQEVKHQSYSDTSDSDTSEVDTDHSYSEPTLEAALPPYHSHPQSFTVHTRTCFIPHSPDFQREMQRIPDAAPRQTTVPHNAYLSDPFIASLRQFLPQDIDPKKKFISETYRSLTPQKSSFIDTSKITDPQIKKQIEHKIKTLTELRHCFQISFAEYIFLIQDDGSQKQIEKIIKDLLCHVSAIRACEAALEKLFQKC